MKDFINIENINPNNQKINKQPRKINRKKLAMMIMIVILVIAIITIVILYASVTPFRKFFDKYIFQKIVSEEKLVSIQLDYDSNINVIGYNQYICVLAENTLKQYRASGDLVNEIKLEISNPVYHVNNKYLAISEKGSSKIYLIADNKVAWEKEVDGNIAKIDVNRNGYVAVILTGTTYKSVIVTYDAKGNELFKTYLASTNALDATVSMDNQYLAFAEIGTSGTQIQSNVKIVSISKAKESPSDSIIYTYEAPSNSLITNIEYQNKNRLICIYDDSIHMISDNQDEVIMNLQENDKKINHADIRVTNFIYRAVEKSTGLFQADTIIEMMNIESRKETIYTIEGIAKNIYCYDNIIAVNLGQEIEFFNTSGWLIKKYTSSQEVQSITITNGMAGIIYRDKVEIINL